MSDNIPFEVQVEIIKRLPVKSVVQFRSVSKSWKSLIDSTRFIVDYSSQHTQVQHLLVRYYDKNFEHKYVSVVDDDTFPEHKVSHTVPVVAGMCKQSSIIGNSHGLLCLYSDHQDGLGGPNFGMGMAVLWNLSIRKSVAIVVPNVGSGINETVLGFGVCRETNDPKIVKITHGNRLSDMESINSIPLKVEVFTLSTGAWRTPYSSNLPRDSIRFGWSKVFIDGVLYWLVTDRKTMDGEFTYQNLIVSFDMTSEEFREISLPDCIVPECFISLSLSKLNGSLIVIEIGGFHVWRMQDGVSKLFTKLFTLAYHTPYEYFDIVIGFRKTGEPIIECSQDCSESTGSVAVYDTYSNSITKLGINGTRFSFAVSPYMETLLLLDQPDSIIYDNGKRYIQIGEVRTTFGSIQAASNGNH